MASIGNVAVKIGVTAEPSREFGMIAGALGFFRVVPCPECAYVGTHKCPIKDDIKYMAFCSFGDRRDDAD